MKKFFAKIGMTLTATAAGALFMAVSTTSAHAFTYENYFFSGLTDVEILDLPVIKTTVTLPSAVIRTDSQIAVARLDGGRFIPTPRAEVTDWEFLDRRMSVDITEMNASDYWKYIPEIPFQGSQDTMNKIDEIRLTAANEGKDFVLIYGVGPDASWASFGKRALSQTGLTVHKDCKSWDDAKAKALLVDSFTGEVVGAVTADDIEFNIGQLADRVGELIQELSA